MRHTEPRSEKPERPGVSKVREDLNEGFLQHLVIISPWWPDSAASLLSTRRPVLSNTPISEVVHLPDNMNAMPAHPFNRTATRKSSF